MKAIFPVLTALFVAVPILSDAREVAPPGGPCATLQGDPREEEIADERLQALFCPALAHAGGAAAVSQMWHTPPVSPLPCALSEEDNTYVQSAAQSALQSIPVDWYTYRVCLWVALASGCVDGSWFKICASALEIPRGEKISDEHGQVLAETLQILGYVGNSDALDLLERATTREYWSASFRSRVISTDPVRAVASMQTTALFAIGFAPPEQAIPFLQRIGAKYPDKNSHAQRNEDYRFEVIAGAMCERLLMDSNWRLREGKKP